MTGLRVKARLGLIGLRQAAHAADHEEPACLKNTANFSKASGSVVPDQAVQTTAVDHDIKRPLSKERHRADVALAERTGKRAFGEPFLGPGNSGFGNINAMHLVALLSHQSARRHAIAAPEFEHLCRRLGKAFPFKPIKRLSHAREIPLTLNACPAWKTRGPQTTVFRVIVVHKPIRYRFASYLIQPVASTDASSGWPLRRANAAIAS